MTEVKYLDPDGMERSGALWAEAPSVTGFVRCRYLRRDGRWIVIGTATKDRKVRQIAATERPGQTLEHDGGAFAVIDGPKP
jgi:ribosomal protein L36